MNALVLNLAIPYARKPLKYIPQMQLEGSNAEKDAFLLAMIRECEAWDGELEGYEVRAVRLSGGACTVMSPDLLGRLLSAVRAHFPLKRGCEVSFDALPGTIGTPSLSGISAGRPNRAELFLRSASDLELRTLSAPFQVNDARIAMQFMSRFHLNNIGVTVHYGIPGQTVSSCLATARDLVIQRPHHIRLLPLSDHPLEGGPDRSLQKEMFLAAADCLKEAGYLHYMAGYFCLPHHEWLYPILRSEGTETVSLGPGAVTALGGYVTRNTNNVRLYLRDAGDFEKQTAEAYALPKEVCLSNALRGSLAMAVGCDIQKLEEKFGASLSEEDRQYIETLLSAGVLLSEGDVLKVASEGMFDLASAREL